MAAATRPSCRSYPSTASGAKTPFQREAAPLACLSSGDTPTRGAPAPTIHRVRAGRVICAARRPARPPHSTTARRLRGGAAPLLRGRRRSSRAHSSAARPSRRRQQASSRPAGTAEPGQQRRSALPPRPDPAAGHSGVLRHLCS